ncbi:MAG: ATP-binding protein [Kofleriaceae bacterium]|nr:ATP-binding protein [Kofleriaceae bacterium]
MDDGVSREAMHLQLERWRARAERAVARRGGRDVDELDEQIEELERELARAELRHARMRALAARLGLVDLEVDLLWWIVAAASEPAVLRASESLGGSRARRGASLALFAEVAAVAPEAARDLALQLARGHRLIASGLVRQADDEVSAASPLTPTPRLMAYLAGDDLPEPPIERIAIDRATRDRFVYDLEQLATLRSLVDLLAPTARVLLAIEGPARTGRRHAVAFAAGRPVLSLDLERLGNRPAAVGAALRALRRELALVDAVPVLANVTIDRVAAAETFAMLAAFVEETAGPLVLTTRLHALDLGSARPVVRVTWTAPDVAARATLWRQALGADADLGPGGLDQLAHRYRLGPGGIARAVASTRIARVATPDSRLTLPELVGGVRHNIAEGLAGVATRVEVTQSWADLVLAEDTLDQVNGLVARLRHGHQVLDGWGYREKLARGAGVAALFSGPPGTGKTMVAGLIARELDLELYQVDLSQVVSKWVGETEKQLARVFDAAEAGHALLLFDEADALFGQRSTETRGAVDRYANLEVNFLLQRIEAFGGVTVLTTNLDAAIDKALKRRLAGHVVFAAPDDDERATLWRRCIRTATAPLGGDHDYDELAMMFPTMSGANIRNAAIAAAFFAARDGASAIGQEHLERAGRVEYRSMGFLLADRSRGQGSMAR